MSTPAELGYLAGVIDGEGHVSVRKAQIAFVLCMADTPILDWCLEHFGGSLSGTWRPEGATARPRRMWTLSRKNGLERVARELLPYLVLKRREVEIMLEAIDHGKGRPGVNNARFRDWQLGAQQIHQRCHEAMLARK